MRATDIDDPRAWHVIYSDHGFHIDKLGTYLDDLEILAARLPPGARRLVREPGHFGYGDRSLHDMTFQPTHISTGLGVRFCGNPFKHDNDVEISYHDVQRIVFVDRNGCAEPLSVALTCAEEYSYLVDGVALRTRPSWMVWIDQVFSCDDGCVHRIVCDQGIVLVWCADLGHQWIPAWFRWSAGSTGDAGPM